MSDTGDLLIIFIGIVMIAGAVLLIGFVLSLFNSARIVPW